MAHNNGMVPRQKKARGPKGMSDNAARFQAAVDAVPLLAPEADVAIDPAYQTVPISEFVPHRPARPEKSDGSQKFKLVSDYVPAGDQRTSIPELAARVNANDRDQVLQNLTGSGKTFTMGKKKPATERPVL